MGELFVIGVLEEELMQAGDLQSHQRMGPAQDHGPGRGLDQRPRFQVRADRDRLASLDPQAIIHQEVRPPADRIVSQRIGPRAAKTTVGVASD